MSTPFLELHPNANFRMHYSHGLRSPNIRLTLTVNRDFQREWWDHFSERLIQASDGRVRHVPGIAEGTTNFIPVFLGLMQQFHASSNLPVYETGRAQQIAYSPSQYLVLVPTTMQAFRPVMGLANWIVGQFNAIAQGVSDEHLRSTLPALLDGIRQASPSRSNVLPFLQAACELNMPVVEVADFVQRIGQGAYGRWIDSSFTDTTPQISARLARNKFLAASVMRQAGLPCPDHMLVQTAEDALAGARKIGFPVVVKPVDADGGAGVSAGLMTEASVQQAFEKARVVSNHILVERHFEGRDYRLVVFQGELVKALERVPGGVTGDGRHTVQQLIALANEDPRRGSGTHFQLKPLSFDDEARSAINELGLTEHSVPKAGQFVRLRRAANVASGGVPVGVLDRVHPLNRELAIRAAEALRLDLAGVDLLIPDISVPWTKSGAAICEINGQPRLGQLVDPELYAGLLRKIVDGNGRIPTAVVIGAKPGDALIASLRRQLSRIGLNCASVDSSGFYIGDHRIDAAIADPSLFGTMMMQDRRVKSAIFGLNDDLAFHRGVATDHIDLVVLAGLHFGAVEDSPDLARAKYQRTIEAIIPACNGTVCSIAGSNVSVVGLEHLTKAKWYKDPIAPSDIINFAAQRLRAADKLHRQA